MIHINKQLKEEWIKYGC